MTIPANSGAFRTPAKGAPNEKTTSDRFRRQRLYARKALRRESRRAVQRWVNSIAGYPVSNSHLYASAKYGTFEGDRSGRHFTDMTQETFEKLRAPFNERTIVETMITGDVREGREWEKWLNGVVRKGRKTPIESTRRKTGEQGVPRKPIRPSTRHQRSLDRQIQPEN